MNIADPARANDRVSGKTPAEIACRLCDAPAGEQFELTLIGRHRVRFFECGQCGSLQSETPYWLDEAYANSNLAMLDTGAAQRNLNNVTAVYIWARMTGLGSVMDVGGGDGLLCRLLRDYGIDARLQDRYALNTYAKGFDALPARRPVAHTAFEVLEHFADPKTDLDALFADRPDSIIITTLMYEGQGRNWWYLVPDSGQHVFFYTRRALAMIAKRFGYHVIHAGKYSIFVKRRLNAVIIAIARLALTAVGIRLCRSLLMLMPAPGPARDFQLIAKRDAALSTACPPDRVP